MSSRKPQCRWPLCECPPYDGTDRCPKLGGTRHPINTMEIGGAPWWHEKYGPFLDSGGVVATRSVKAEGTRTQHASSGMSRTSWALALLSLAGALTLSASLGIAGTPMDGVGTAGFFTAIWAAGVGFVRSGR